MATRENPDAIELDVSKIYTSGTSNTDMTDTDKAREEATLATYQKMADFTTLKKTDAQRSIGGHKSHLTRTQNAADRAVSTTANMPCPATINNMERCLDAYYTKADTMELAY